MLGRDVEKNIGLLVDVGFVREQVVKMVGAFPSILGLNAEANISTLVDAGFTREQVPHPDPYLQHW